MPAKIIILGKPNVGKSSLFNVILKKNIAIVDDHPGLTRDIRKKKIRLWDKECELIDSPGFCESSNKINKKIKDYTIEYSKLADVVLLVFDGRSELSSEDLDIISYSRKLNKPILPVINKTEGRFLQEIVDILNKMGLGETFRVSAAHNQSIDELKWKIYNLIKDLNSSEEGPNNSDDLTVAIVGKTNTGKSTIFNLINKKKLALTGSQANLTRDSVESTTRINNIDFKIFDTAGFSKNNREKIHKLSINQTLKKIRLCKIIIIVFDINDYFEKINSKIVNQVFSENRCNILLINKMDSMKELQEQEVLKHIHELNPQLEGVPTLFVSAKKNYGFETMHSVISKQLESWNKRIKTSELNDWLLKVMIENPPPLKNGRIVKLKYISQVSVSPPKFNIFSNFPSSLNSQYKRYISNKLKRNFVLEGIPIKILFKKANNPYDKS